MYSLTLEKHSKYYYERVQIIVNNEYNITVNKGLHSIISGSLFVFKKYIQYKRYCKYIIFFNTATKDTVNLLYFFITTKNKRRINYANFSK